MVKYTLYDQFRLKYTGKWQNDTVTTKATPIFQHIASCTTGLKQMGSLRRVSDPQALHISNRWTIMSGRHAGKVPWNPAEAQDDWRVESRFADYLIRADTRTHQQGGGKLHQSLYCLYDRQWWSLRASAVTLSISKFAFTSQHQKITSSVCSNSVHLKVCIHISAPKNRLFWEPPTYYWKKQRSKRWKLHITFCPR